MEAQLIEIRDQQREVWNRFSPGWKKWDEMMMTFLKPVGDQIIRFLKPKYYDLALDVASGTGEPGLTIATMLNGGIVVVTDLSEGMLDVARSNAARRSVKNLDFVACDVSELPFADNSFDIISCRFGFMFFPDMSLAIKEMARVLRPGGRIAAAVWNVPEKNFWASASLSSINKYMQLPPPPPGAPGLFRCSESSLIADLFRQAGLRNISGTEVNGKLRTGTAEVYWNFMTDVVVPVVAALSKADNSLKATIKNDVIETINQKFPDGIVEVDSNALVIYAEK